jgi:uncharacterized membrane protein (TIGR02234 family)
VTDRLTSKPMVLILMLGAAALILVSGSREWVSGSVEDAVLGASQLHGGGAEVAPGVMASAMVGLAAGVAATTSGRLLRFLAALSALLSAVLGAALVIVVLADPGGALGQLAATGTGRSGTLDVQGRAGPWVWVALAAMLVMGVGGLGALAGGRRWQGLSDRYDIGEPDRKGAAGSAVSGSGGSVASGAAQWDQLSRGEDPTAPR